jgi:hypothetical protein
MSIKVKMKEEGNRHLFEEILTAGLLQKKHESIPFDYSLRK